MRDIGGKSDHMRIHIDLAVGLYDWLRRHTVAGPVLTLGLEDVFFNSDELDRALGPAHTSHAAIRTHGGGSYSHWQERVYFSTTDHSNPNRNGRRYVAIVPAPPSF
jgi:hypothetical protein